jgi:glucuronate isomerase
MKDFLNSDFLLDTDTASELYHQYAEKMPIIDYHCHLSPQLIEEDHQFSDLTELWLSGDHYKWRAMRTNGVDESLITGNATPWQKFEAWAATVPYTMGNPLYHWTHLELQRTFGIHTILNPDSALDIYNRCNELLKQPEYSARGLISHFNVEVLCTTDDPIDSLVYQRQIRKSGFSTKVLPTWRPDKLTAVSDTTAYKQYILALEKASDTNIGTFGDLTQALQKRHNYFHEQGCRLSDHGLTTFYAEPYTPAEIELSFEKLMQGKELTTEEQIKYQSAMLYIFGCMDAESGWTQQYHYGALRNNNSLMMQRVGPDTGFDSIGDWNVAQSLSRFLDRLNREDKLARTILYNLNPNANEMIATMTGNFQDGTIPGKIQFGSSWWFMDQKEGMQRQLKVLSNLSLLSRFVGMLTDSRSFVSYPRHEYFRRILCNLLGHDIEQGELPADELPWIGQMIKDICYYNAKTYFRF